MKIKAIVCLILAINLLCVSVSAGDIISAPTDLDRGPAANEIGSGYDTTFVSAGAGYAKKVYRTGGWFSNARGNTEIWGSTSLPLSAYSGGCSVSISNSNYGYYDSDSSSAFDSNRYCQCYATISSNYATSLTHYAYLYYDGVLQFSQSSNTP